MSEPKAEEVTLDSSGNEDDEIRSYDAHDFEKRLIEEVKKRPFLFDHTNDGFKDLKRKDLAWGELAEALGKDGDVSVSKCQCRWKSLRDRYVRESRKIREGGGPKRRMWEMFKYLTFLEEVPRLYRGGSYAWAPPGKSRRSTSRRPAAFILPSSSPPPLQPQQELQFDISSGPTIHSSSPPPPIVHIAPTPPTIIPTPTSPASILAVHLTEKPTVQAIPRKQVLVPQTMNSTPNFNNACYSSENKHSGILTTFVDMADGCSAFGMSISATLRSLPLEQQELAKLRIQQALYDIQFS